MLIKILINVNFKYNNFFQYLPGICLAQNVPLAASWLSTRGALPIMESNTSQPNTRGDTSF